MLTVLHYEIYNFCCEDWPYFIICPICRKHNISAADTSNFSYTLSVGNSPFLHIFHNIIDYISTQFLHFEILPVIIMKCDLYYIFPKRKFKKFVVQTNEVSTIFSMNAIIECHFKNLKIENTSIGSINQHHH